MFSLISSILFASLALAATYSRTASIVGADFNHAFTYQAIKDPTHGSVNYVDFDTASRKNLTYASSDTFILRADHNTKLSASGPGRDSVRLISKQTYTTAVMVFNIRHMPQGCGTWPAVWTVGKEWPDRGEIDIVEGVNDVGPNKATLHTAQGCTMLMSRRQTGKATSTDCASSASHVGCGVTMSQDSSFGPAFNSIGGGWYAMERTNAEIKIWFWPRNSFSVPQDVKMGGNFIDTGGWGIASASFPSTDCDVSSFFGEHNIIINLTFCGDWAGQQNVYSSSGCPSTCIDYVNNNPSAFSNAYYNFASLKIYE